MAGFLLRWDEKKLGVAAIESGRDCDSTEIANEKRNQRNHRGIHVASAQLLRNLSVFPSKG